MVRPRLTGTQISGLGTLLSGAYIGMDVGTATEARREFTGLDVPPIVTVDLPGRQFQLYAADLGSLDVGSPVYFRRIQVGTVVAFELDKDGTGVQLSVFINAPYDRHVKADTRFWQASGFYVALDASGIRLNTESVASMLLGGVAFQAPPESRPAPPAQENARFTLYADRDMAMRRPDTAEETYRVVFDETVRGLALGAPVDFRGVVVGEVTAIDVEYAAKGAGVRIPVEVRLYPDRLRGKAKQTAAAPGALIESLVARGLRAQLRSGSLLTGQLFVALDFFPDKPQAAVLRRAGRAEIPTVTASLQELQTTLMGIARTLEKLPLEGLVADARSSLKALESTLAATELAVKRVEADLAPQAGRTLADLSHTLSDVEKTLAGAQRRRCARWPITLSAIPVRSCADAPRSRQSEARRRTVRGVARACRLRNTGADAALHAVRRSVARKTRARNARLSCRDRPRHRAGGARPAADRAPCRAQPLRDCGRRPLVVAAQTRDSASYCR